MRKLDFYVFRIINFDKNVKKSSISKIGSGVSRVSSGKSSLKFAKKAKNHELGAPLLTRLAQVNKFCLKNISKKIYLWCHVFEGFQKNFPKIPKKCVTIWEVDLPKIFNFSKKIQFFQKIFFQIQYAYRIF